MSDGMSPDDTITPLPCCHCLTCPGPTASNPEIGWKKAVIVREQGSRRSRRRRRRRTKRRQKNEKAYSMANLRMQVLGSGARAGLIGAASDGLKSPLSGALLGTRCSCLRG
jgi:hypothetical protein